MAIKKLQNDFTTPEQSKRLLELGVPEDSANYCYECSLIGGEKYYSRELLDDTIFTEYKRNWESPYVDVIPCWSVGRLMEIYVIARGLDTAYLPIERGEDMVKYLIRLYEEKARDLDFSKLED